MFAQSQVLCLSIAALFLISFGTVDATQADVASETNQANVPYNQKFDLTLNRILRTGVVPARKMNKNKAFHTGQKSEAPTDLVGVVGLRASKSDQTLVKLRSLGVQIDDTYLTRKVFTAKARVHQLSSITEDEFPGLVHLRYAHELQINLDRSVPMLFGGSPTSSTDYGVDGSGVIFGMVDTGIDPTHNDFGSRITHYLHQWSGASGSPSTVCVENCCECQFIPHGTHVASTAAGRYGVAPQAEIRVVETTLMENDIIDGINWLLNNRGNKPIVINLSLGGMAGSHDGKSIYSLAVREAVRGGDADGPQLPGVAIVYSAGNSYSDGVSLQHEFTWVGEVSEFGLSLDGLSTQVLVQAWYPSEDGFDVTVTSPSGVVFTSSGSSTGSGIVSISQGGSNTDGSARLIEVSLYDYQSNLEGGIWTLHWTSTKLEAQSQNHKLSAWIVTSDSEARFVGSTGIESISDDCTGEDVICVAASFSKDSWKVRLSADSEAINFGYCEIFGTDPVADGSGCSDGTLGKLAYFSSHGPTRDGRIKPDITAPGALIAAAHGRNGQSIYGEYDSYFQPDQTDAGWDSSSQYILLQGTSMAAPHVSGAIANLFQIDPSLTSDDILALLAMTAVWDESTGVEGPYGWGAGKLSLGQAIETLRQRDPSSSSTPHPSPTPSRRSTKEPCKNKDSELVALAQANGIYFINSCADVSDYCYSKQYFHILSRLCPLTCMADNNELLAELACLVGYCSINSCSQVAGFCSDRSVGYALRVVCGATCGWCSQA